MFVPVPFDSVNSPASLEPGDYESFVQVFGEQSGSPRLCLFQYRPAGTDEVVAVDLLGIDSDGTVRVRDFVWMRDRCWRDSTGLRSNDLGAMLPPEVMAWTLLETRQLEPVFVKSPMAPNETGWPR